MTTNPLTNKPMTTGAQDAYALKAEKAATAAHTLVSEAGKLPMNARMHGHTKTFFYTLSNACTVGIVGQFGAWAARTSYMSSARNGVWGRMVKDLGQSHLNATQDLGAFMNTVNKVVAHGVGFIPGHALGVGFVLDVKMANPGRHYFENTKEAAGHNTIVNFDRMKHMGIGDLGNLRNAGKSTINKVRREIDRAQGADTGDQKSWSHSKDYEDVRTLVLDGSNALRGMFLDHVRKEFSAENAMFYQWAQPELDKLSKGASENDPGHGLSRYELAVAYEDFMKKGTNSKTELNLPSKMFGRVQATFEDENGPIPKAYRNRVARSRKNVRRAEAAFIKARRRDPDSQDTIRKLFLYVEAENRDLALRNADGDRLTHDESLALAPVLQDAAYETARLMRDSFTRFNSRLNQAHLNVQGHQEIDRTEISGAVERRSNGFAQKLINLGVPSHEARSIAEDHYGSTTNRSVHDNLSRAFFDGRPKYLRELAKLDRHAKQRLSLLNDYRNALRELSDQMTAKLVEKGMPPQQAEHDAKEWLAADLARVPASGREADDIIGNIRANMDGVADTLTSHLNVEAPFGLVATGGEARINYSKTHLGTLSEIASGKLFSTMRNHNSTEWTGTAGTVNEGVAASFVRDFEGTRITVNDDVVSDPEDERATTAEQKAQCKENLALYGIADKDISLVTAAVHQGLGSDLQELARISAGPNRLEFQDHGTKEHNRDGDGVTIKITPMDDGTYQFTFTASGALSGVQDAVMRQGVYPLDPAGSHMTRQISGIVDPGAKENARISYTNVSVTYTATPAVANR